jgi:hypothetical protein
MQERFRSWINCGGELIYLGKPDEAEVLDVKTATFTVTGAWRKQEHFAQRFLGQKHLASFEGKLQVDAYAGFEPLFLPTKPGVAARVQEISCMAHARRHFF